MSSMFDDTKSRVIREHGEAVFKQANRECSDLIPRLIDVLAGHSNLAAGNALVVLAAAVARADGVPFELLARGMQEAYDSPIVRSLADSLRAAMAELGRA